MPLPFFFQALLLGFQHTFEPDHLAAVSVLATSRRSLRADFWRILWRSSQWALGHGLSLMVLSVAALVFKSSLPTALSGLVEVWVVGPVMIVLGVLALRRAFTLVTHVHAPEPAHAPAVPAIGAAAAGVPALHTHPHPAPARGARVGRSFGVGMLHGAAGTGGALAIALGLAADSPAMALGILALESLGVLLAMSAYALLLVYAAKRLAARHTALLRGLNVVVGLVSIAVGVLWLQRGLVG
jgi:cytochrome c biogenesis protein CcdA